MGGNQDETATFLTAKPPVTAKLPAHDTGTKATQTALSRRNLLPRQEGSSAILPQRWVHVVKLKSCSVQPKDVAVVALQ